MIENEQQQYSSEPFNYDHDYKQLVDTPLEFWNEIANKFVYWDTPFVNVMGGTIEYPLWFEGGALNACYNILDKQALNPDIKNRTALIHTCPYKGIEEKLTYSELYDRVCEFSTALRSIGIKKGDRVLIYMPNINQTIISTLTCFRLGAICNIVYGGYPSHQLAMRIDSFKPNLLLSSDFGIYGTETISYYGLINNAIELSNHKVDNIIIYSRKDLVFNHTDSIPEGSLDWYELINKSTNQFTSINREYTPVESTHPLNISYTSGTSSQPKGIVKSTAGTLVAIMYYLCNNIALNKVPGVYFSKTDFGWETGQIGMVYTPFLNGLTSIIYEGSSVEPKKGLWSVVEKYKVNYLMICADLELLMKYDDSHLFNLSSLRALMTGGRKVLESTSIFYKKITGLHLIEVYGSTEAMSIIGNSTRTGVTQLGVTGFPMPGFSLVIVDENSQPVGNGEAGELVIKLPVGPGVATTIDNNHQQYIKSYLAKHKGYFATGDLAIKRDDGYINVLSRLDDIVVVNGIKISMEPVEEAISSHEAIAESIAIVIEQPNQKDYTIGLVVLKSIFLNKDKNNIISQIGQLVEKKVGGLPNFKTTLFIERIPKNRNGKTLKKMIANIFNGKSFEIPSTIQEEGQDIIQEIQQIYKDYCMQ
ncbi:hypothetical protein CYY_007104 [Polysphondylium violaceum]|uniref:Uncharacterized protein n=1 Tax=Polysphondylium violaceum TaxID=133409 RepID=A0A8J4PR94_9MYCE|nr:hypothetical protein CYY_007104 [Polysphondylium violaceum]